MPKPSGKVNCCLYFEESDEDDSSTPKLSKNAQVLEDYFTQNDPPAAKPSTSITRSPLLPTLTLMIKDYNVGDIVVKVCINFKQLRFNICNLSTHHSPHGLNQYICIWLMYRTHGQVHPIQLMRFYMKLWNIIKFQVKTEKMLNLHTIKIFSINPCSLIMFQGKYCLSLKRPLEKTDFPDGSKTTSSGM